MVFYSEETDYGKEIRDSQPEGTGDSKQGGLELTVLSGAPDEKPAELKIRLCGKLCFGAMIFPSLMAPIIYGASDAMDPGMPYRELVMSVMPAALLPYLLFKPRSKAPQSGAKWLGFKAKMVGIGAVAEGLAYCAGYAAASAIDTIF